MHLPDNVNVSENDESADEPVSETLESCTERSFLSQRQCRLIYQHLRNSDLCLEENFCAQVEIILMVVTPSDKDFMTFLQPKDGPLVIMT